MNHSEAEKRFGMEFLSEIEETERTLVAGNMSKHGGAFAQALGEALFRADATNARKIHQTWPDLWEKYRAWPASQE